MVEKFTISIDQSRLEDLEKRLSLTTFPDEVRCVLVSSLMIGLLPLSPASSPLTTA